MIERAPIVEEQFDITDSDAKLWVRIYAPVRDEDATWACRIQVSDPIDVDRNAYGEGSLQALALALGQVSSLLYSSPLWREGKLRAYGAGPRSYLGLPAPTSYHDFAPFPFC